MLMISEEFSKWMHEHGRKVQTVKEYQSVLKDLASWYQQVTNGQISDGLTSLSAIDLQDYREYLANHAKTKVGKSLAPRTINKRLEAIRTYFHFLADTKRIPVNPALKLKLYKIQDRSDSVRWLDRNEKNKLIRYFEDEQMKERNMWRLIRNKAIVFTMMHAGLRVGELVGLDVNEDIDLDTRLLNVRAGKGGKFRRVELNKEITTLLRKWLVIRKEGPHPDSLKLFTSQKGELTIDGVEHIFRQLRKKVNLPDLTPHVLRHTFGHDMVEKGVRLDLLADMLGHDDINTTRIYTKSSSNERRKAVELLSAERD